MKKLNVFMLLILLTASMLSAYGPPKEDEDLFQEAKVLIFDKRWEDAERILDRLMRDYPDSRLFSQALFYKGKCLKEQKGREVQALETFQSYLEARRTDRNLVRESEWAITDLALALFERGRRSYLREAEKRLESRDPFVRQYTAIRFSLLKDKKAASKGLPVLMDMLEHEENEELRDRAKLALLRIDPDALNQFEERSYGPVGATLCIRAIKKSSGRTTLSLNIPWALADLALSAIPAKERGIMRREGYDLDKIIKELTRFRGNIIEFEDEETLIKIWIK